jgi:hypothetical protein
MPSDDPKKKKKRPADKTAPLPVVRTKEDTGPLPIVDELTTTPSLDELYQAFESAYQNQGTSVNLGFRLPEQNDRYVLSVVCPLDQSVQPSWTLAKRHEDGKIEPAWTYTGDDVALIQVHLKGLSAFSAAPMVPQTEPDFTAANVIIDTVFPFSRNAEPQRTAVLEALEAPFYAPIARDFPMLRKQHELILQPETGILAQWSITYFLEQEYYRFKACNYPVILALYDLGVQIGTEVKPLIASHIRQIGQRISRAKRRIDHFGHFGVTIYALVLPHTEYEAGQMVAKRIKSLIEEDAAARNIPLVVRMGVAGLPVDAIDVDSLITVAAERMI